MGTYDSGVNKSLQYRLQKPDNIHGESTYDLSTQGLGFDGSKTFSAGL